MTAPKHTPDKWFFDERVRCAAVYPESQKPDGDKWANGLHPTDHGRDIVVYLAAPTDAQCEWLQNAVACVNACEGINPEAVPDLLAACKAVLAKQSDASIFRLPDNCDAMKKIRTAIAKAEGGAAC